MRQLRQVRISTDINVELTRDASDNLKEEDEVRSVGQSVSQSSKQAYAMKLFFVSCCWDKGRGQLR